MKKATLLIITLLIFGTVKAQPDCSFRYSITGKLNFSNNLDSQKLLIYFPTPEFISGQIDSLHGFNSFEVMKNQCAFRKSFVTIGSSFFCIPLRDIIDKTLKSSLKYYTIIIIKGGKIISKQIAIHDIKFYYNSDEILIELPTIMI